MSTPYKRRLGDRKEGRQPIALKEWREKEGILDPDGTPCKFIPREKWQKPEIDSKVCDGCGLCIEDCPAYCLALEKGVSVLTDKDACLGCGICVRRCPIQAIKLK